MGKAKKNRKFAGDAVKPSSEGLANQIEAGFRIPNSEVGAAGPAATAREKAGRKRNIADDEKFLESGLSRRILNEAKKQINDDEEEEEEEEEGDSDVDEPAETKKRKPRTISLVLDEGAGEGSSSNKNKRKKAFQMAVEADEDDSDAGPVTDDDDYGDEHEPVELDAGEEAAMARFMSSEPVVRRTLADIIMEKIEEKQRMANEEFKENDMDLTAGLDPRVVEMYEGVKKVLKTYRSGKLPKAFKIIPMMSNWEQIVQITCPEEWSAAAMYQGTRIFVSNMNSKLCQRFLNLVILPRVRDDIAEFKKLNFHLFQALKKGLFKPAAFFKGILLPLCESGTCTLREATIIGSVMAKCTIPAMHTAACMLKIAEMEYSGANSLFLRILIDKKYTLPYRVIDGLVGHFVRFVSDEREMTVLWHQCLLALVQRYKADLASEQKDQIHELLKLLDVDM